MIHSFWDSYSVFPLNILYLYQQKKERLQVYEKCLCTIDNINQLVSLKQAIRRNDEKHYDTLDCAIF